MARKAGACVLLGLFGVVGTLAGCGVGDEAIIDTEDPNDVLGIVCNAAFSIHGTWTEGTPTRPIDIDTGLPQTGCWPVGTWTFTATVDNTASQVPVPCSPDPTVLSEYKFQVDRMDDGTGNLESYTYLTEPSAHHRLKVSEVGGGCEAGLEIYSPDGLQYWNLKAKLEGAGPTIGGFGEYALYKTDQW